jgi:AcrR family transcriptional regulator
VARAPRAGEAVRDAPGPDHGTPAAGPDPAAPSTRERILDIALDLFIEQGFDKTSLRQIAEQLGFSKAALYYHFASKGDILMALHLRFHDLGKESFAALEKKPSSPEAWVSVFDNFITMMMENRKMFVLHERNHAAFENLHRQEHDAEHDDMGERLRGVLRDPSVAVEQRVRMACAMGAVMGGLVLAGDAFADVSSDDLSAMLRAAIGNLFGVSTGKPAARAGKVPAPSKHLSGAGGATRRNGST